jgi:RNA polymerase sigma-70 factor (ECF subfamily)
MAQLKERQIPETGAPTFDDLYEAEVDYVWNLLQRLGVRASELDDLTHEVFLKVYFGLPTYDPSRPLRPWLSGITYRVFADHLRRGRQQPTSPEALDEMPHSGASPEGMLSSKQEQRLVQQALERLEPERRIIFIMHELEGHSVPDIASALGAGLNTTYSRLRLARRDFVLAVRTLSPARGES